MEVGLIFLSAETIRTESKIYLPFGQGRHVPVGGKDLARVIVGVLLDPEPHDGKTYIPTGPRLFSMEEMAEVFAGVLGRSVQYIDILVEKWRQILSRYPWATPVRRPVHGARGRSASAW